MADSAAAASSAAAAPAAVKPKSPDVPGGAKDIWQIIQSQIPPNAQEQQDINILVVGSKGCGRSTLINRFIHKDDASGAPPKPTTALEYTHAKREEAKGVKVAHFWELGGGQQLASLVDVVITPENIHTVMVVIVLDLSEPSTVFDSAVFWLSRIKKRVAEILLKMSQKGSTTPGKMFERIQKRFEGNPDLDSKKITIIGVPLLIVGSKYDVFRKEGSEYAKTMGKTLRFMAHSFAASLVFTSQGDEREIQKYRALMNHLVFASPLSAEKILQTDPQQALFMISGKDTFEKIGPPQGTAKPASGVKPCGIDGFDVWKAPFETVFPKKVDEGAGKEISFDIANAEFAEPMVDAMRVVKNDELEQYRQLRAKKGQTSA